MNPPNEHMKEAKRLVAPRRSDPPIPASDGDVAEAQVHASLAIAEQLEQLNETLKEAPHLLDQIAVGVNR